MLAYTSTRAKVQAPGGARDKLNRSSGVGASVSLRERQISLT
jgi:hypothetical protein